MILKFDDYYKRRDNGDGMSTALNYIKQFESADQILNEYNSADSIAVDIFDIAKKMGVHVKDSDFKEFEKAAQLPEDSVLGAIIDITDDDSLTILIKNSLGSSEFYNGMSEAEKIEALRRRRRFTLSHEISHALLHISENNARFRFDSRLELDPLADDEQCDKEEREANIFAGELLIPEKILSKVCEKMTIPTLNVLCDIFDVSHSVMRARLRHLGIWYVDDYART